MNDKAGLERYAFVGLGANLPSGSSSPAETLKAVIPAMARLSAAPLLVSRLYISEPKDCPPGSPLYVNAVAALLPGDDETPDSFLGKLQALENGFGRARTGTVNEARTLDLDLLYFGNKTSATQTLVLPHPRAHQRRFVLEPWIELVGERFQFQQHTLGYWLAENQDPQLALFTEA